MIVLFGTYGWLNNDILFCFGQTTNIYNVKMYKQGVFGRFSTSSGRDHVDEFLGISHVVGCDGHKFVRLPHTDAIGKSDKIEVIVGPQLA